MKSAVGMVMVIAGIFVGPAAFAGQLNALGQWMPSSTDEGRRTWGESRVAEQVAERAGAGQSTSIGYVPAARTVRTRVDALGREVPIQTNLP